MMGMTDWLPSGLAPVHLILSEHIAHPRGSFLNIPLTFLGVTWSRPGQHHSSHCSNCPRRHNNSHILRTSCFVESLKGEVSPLAPIGKPSFPLSSDFDTRFLSLSSCFLPSAQLDSSSSWPES